MSHRALAPVCEVLGRWDIRGDTVECHYLSAWLFLHRLGKTNREDYLASETASLQSVSALGSQFWCRLTL